MYNYKLTVAYHGKYFQGWQWNPKEITVQSTLEEALTKVHQMPIKVIGASRTDAGVHSYGQTCNFSTEKLWPTETLQRAVNYYLDKSRLLVTRVELVALDFHSRYKSLGKIYHYQIYLDEFLNPLDHGLWWNWWRPIDEKKLQTALTALQSASSLNGFAHWHQPLKNHYTLQKTSYHWDGKKLTLKFQGKGFFYNEIRYLVGHIIHYISGLMDHDDFMLPLENPTNKDYKKILAPAHGLFLMEVLY
jgi:tRNA pseudouridine38-40 synthase